MILTWLWQGLAGDDLQQEHELQPISEILLDVLDLCAGLAQVGVHPSSESLKTNSIKIKTFFRSRMLL